MGAAGTQCDLNFTSTTIINGTDITVAIAANGVTTLTNTNAAP